LFRHLHPGFLSDIEHKLPGNAGQQSGVERWSEGNVVLHDEEICRRALRQLALVVAHHALEGVRPQRLLHGERAVHQVVALDHRVHRRRVIAHDIHDNHPDALLVHLCRGVDLRFDDDHD